MIWVLIGAAAIWGLDKWIMKGQEPDEGKKDYFDRPCILEFNGKYWNGSKFLKDDKEAQKFKNANTAWEYADENFSEEVAEDCNVKFVL